MPNNFLTATKGNVDAIDNVWFGIQDGVIPSEFQNSPIEFELFFVFLIKKKSLDSYNYGTLF